jgi:hypothetical protein
VTLVHPCSSQDRQRSGTAQGVAGPRTNVYVPVDLANANKGRLFIRPTGVVTVQAEKTLADASRFTSLDGASFAP